MSTTKESKVTSGVSTGKITLTFNHVYCAGDLTFNENTTYTLDEFKFDNRNVMHTYAKKDLVLFHLHDTWVEVSYVSGRYVVRISGSVYNEIERLQDAINLKYNYGPCSSIASFITAISVEIRAAVDYDHSIYRKMLDTIEWVTHSGLPGAAFQKVSLNEMSFAEHGKLLEIGKVIAILMYRQIVLVDIKSNNENGSVEFVPASCFNWVISQTADTTVKEIMVRRDPTEIKNLWSYIFLCFTTAVYLNIIRYGFKFSDMMYKLAFAEYEEYRYFIYDRGMPGNWCIYNLSH